VCQTQVPFESIRESLGVEEEVLKRILHSLSCGKYQVRAMATSSHTRAPFYRYNWRSWPLVTRPGLAACAALLPLLLESRNVGGGGRDEGASLRLCAWDSPSDAPYAPPSPLLISLAAEACPAWCPFPPQPTPTPRSPIPHLSTAHREGARKQGGDPQ
jgi:hypothetical protein